MKKILPFIIILSILIVGGCTSPPPQEEKQVLTNEQILSARQNYEVSVNNWKSTGWENRYNPNTGKNTDAFWMRIDLSVKNNNEDVSLNLLTIRVNIKRDGTIVGWGRLPIDVSNIKPGESKTITVYYPGDLSGIVYTTIESDIAPEDYSFFKELR